MDKITNTDLSELTEKIEPDAFPEPAKKTGSAKEPESVKKTGSAKEPEPAENNEQQLPTSEQIEKELSRISDGAKKSNPILTILRVLLVSAAIVVLLTSLLTPVVKVTGSAMQPTLNNSDVSIAVKTTNLSSGDVCCFYNNNNLFVRRVIGVPGDEINIDDDGSVYVNGEPLSETYISEKALGDCNISLPFVVPENSYFVMGDNRPAAKDSRISEIGCVSVDRIVGKLLFTVWPVYSVGIVK